ncbi:RNA-directed DNA polymerase, eukaryota, reverse transcriptase zinc-binding domain protein [Tanacetum coccineum]
MAAVEVPQTLEYRWPVKCHSCTRGGKFHQLEKEVNVPHPSQRNIKVPGRYVDFVFEVNNKKNNKNNNKNIKKFSSNPTDLGEIRECLDSYDENEIVNGEEGVRVEYCQEGSSNENKEQDKVDEGIIDQGVKEVDMENVNRVSSRSDNPTEKFKSNFENGNEVVVFDEDFVNKGSMKWKLTVFGYFVGCDMGINELRHEDGMNKVLEQSPWLVNGKPLFVQKWEPDMNIVKREPTSIPMWIKMYNVPLEAWNTKGINVNASRVGKPVIMDQVTANMCHSRIGRIGFARVLVEIDVAKGYTDKVEILYMDAEKNVKRRKFVDVEYAWKPLVCSHCVVFGHDFKACRKRTRSVEELEKEKQQELERQKDNGK